MNNYKLCFHILLILLSQDIFSQFDLKDRLKIDETMIVAHRGLWRFAPENSMEAVQQAIKEGVDMVEIDVRMTKDSVLILMHDKTIDRTTNGTGKVGDLTYNEISKFYLKNGLGRVTKFKVPSLKKVLLESKSKIFLNIDKSDEFLSQVYDLLIETNTLDQVLLKGWFNYEEFKNKYGHLISKINYMPIIKFDENSNINSVVNKIRQFNCDIIEIIFESDDLSILDSLNYLEKRIWVNSLWPSLCGGRDDNSSLSDPNSNWGWLLEKGVDVIQSDRPLLLKNYINKKKN